MHRFGINYRERDGRTRGQLVNVGFFLHQLPRLMLWCRLFGHKPTVDGTGEYHTAVPSGDQYGNPHRWVVCDRCGVRGDPQGHLDPGVYAIGDYYLGEWAPPRPAKGTSEYQVLLERAKAARVWTGEPQEPRPARPYTLPGPIPRNGGVPDNGDGARGALGGQLIIGRTGIGGWSWELKVGNAGSEHTLAASLYLGPLGSLHLHTERHGTWLQRRLNPTGYESRVTGQQFRDGRLSWLLWSLRDSGSRYGRDREPWWRNGEISFRVLDGLFGPRRYSYEDVGEPVGRFVRMPEGEDFMVTLKLQRQTHGRRRGPVPKTRTWSVDWNTTGKGIPTKGPERGRIYGSGVEVSDASVRAGTWPSEAVCGIATRMVRDRTRYGWEPLGCVKVDAELVPA